MAIASIDTMRTELFICRLISRYSIAAGKIERDMAIASIDTMRKKLFLSRLISRYSTAAGL